MGRFMNFRRGLLNLYRMRLVRRELNLLVIYRQRGRRPRIYQWAYWRASYAPLLLGLVFFGTRSLGLLDIEASMVAVSLLIGYILADMQWFMINATTWMFTKRALDWGMVRQMSQFYVGPTGDLSKPPAANRWDQTLIPPDYLKNLAVTYELLKISPPSLRQVFFKTAEGRGLFIMTLSTCLFVALQPQFTGAILAIYAFFAAWPAKRLKAAVDFHATWPIMQDAFDWTKISLMTGKL